MSVLYVDLENHFELVNTLHEQTTFLSAEEREETEGRIAEAEKHPTALVNLARDVAKKTWPIRHALQQFAETEKGCDAEWKMVVGSVSKSTAHLLQRFRNGTRCVSLDETLAHDDSESAFRDEERREIAAVRTHVQHALWREHHAEIEPLVKEAEAQFHTIDERLQVLRELAVDTPWIEGEVLGKVTQYENTFLFGGKVLSLEQLDAEIASYREQKALPV